MPRKLLMIMFDDRNINKIWYFSLLKNSSNPGHTESICTHKLNNWVIPRLHCTILFLLLI